MGSTPNVGELNDISFSFFFFFVVCKYERNDVETKHYTSFNVCFFPSTFLGKERTQGWVIDMEDYLRLEIHRLHTNGKLKLGPVAPLLVVMVRTIFF